MVWFVASLLFTLGLSKLCWSAWWKWLTKRRHKEDFCRYKRWGMVNEVFGNESRDVWVALSVGWIVSVVFTTLCAVPALDDAKIIFDRTQRLVWVDWLIYLLFVSISGFFWVPLDRHDVDERIKRVESLNAVFRKRFKVSELLSINECLKAAPDIFWKEYSDLPDRQINETTNQKFREWAAPYRARRGEATQRMILVVAVVAILLAAFALAWDVMGVVIENEVKTFLGFLNAE